MSASAKTTRSPSAASIPARTAAPLPPCGTRRTRSVDAVDARPPPPAGPRRCAAVVVRAAVVDDEDVDRLRQCGRAGRSVARLVAAPAQVAEQLVERRADPFRLVEGGQDEGEAHRSPPSGRTRRGRDARSDPLHGGQTTAQPSHGIPSCVTLRLGPRSDSGRAPRPVTVTAMERVQSTGRGLMRARASQPARAAGRPHPDRVVARRGVLPRPGHPPVDLRRHRCASVLRAWTWLTRT